MAKKSKRPRMPEVRVGQTKVVKGKRYKLKEKSRRWERDYTLPVATSEKIAQSEVQLEKDKSGFIHAPQGVDYFSKVAANPERYKELKRVSAVKTYIGKTKTELREEYMFARSNLTRKQRAVMTLGGAYAVVKGAGGSGFLRHNPVISMLNIHKLSETKAWKAHEAFIENKAAKVAKTFGDRTGSVEILALSKRSPRARKLLKTSKIRQRSVLGEIGKDVGAALGSKFDKMRSSYLNLTGVTTYQKGRNWVRFGKLGEKIGNLVHHIPIAGRKTNIPISGTDSFRRGRFRTTMNVGRLAKRKLVGVNSPLYKVSSFIAKGNPQYVVGAAIAGGTLYYMARKWYIERKYHKARELRDYEYVRRERAVRRLREDRVY